MTKTILLVEDEDQVRTLLQRVLSKRDYNVIVAGNGRDGLEKGRDVIGEIDLVVTDLIMPEMSGVELMRELRSLRSDVACLYMTGYSREDIDEPLDGAELIQKPFTPAQLIERIDEILS